MAITTAPTAGSQPFRQHSRAALHLASPLLQQLCQEWTELHASETAAATLARWADTYPALAGLDSPGAITDRIDEADRATKDQIMLALLAAFHDGDQVAGRILLQAMLPGLTHLTRRIRVPRGTHHDETLQRTLTEFWCVISSQENLPPRGVAGRLQLDTLHRLTQHRRTHDAWEEHTSAIADVFDDDDVPPPGSATTVGPLHSPAQLSPATGTYDADAGLLELLLHARDTSVITEDDARFLAEVYVVSDNMAHAARRLGKQPAAVRQRCGRLRRRLIEAVMAEHQAQDKRLSA